MLFEQDLGSGGKRRGSKKPLFWVKIAVCPLLGVQDERGLIRENLPKQMVRCTWQVAFTSPASTFGLYCQMAHVSRIYSSCD